MSASSSQQGESNETFYPYALFDDNGDRWTLSMSKQMNMPRRNIMSISRAYTTMFSKRILRALRAKTHTCIVVRVHKTDNTEC